MVDSPLSYKAGRLHCEQVALERIARAVGTPVYVYSAGTVRARYRELEAAFADIRHAFFYAMKANSNAAICRLLAKEGAGADVVSGGELRRAVRAGIKPGRIVFSGVGKTREEIALALRLGVRSLNIESAEELAAVAREAGRLKKTAPFSVRVNPGVDAGTHKHIATSLPDSKFGVEEKEALALYKKAKRDRRLRAVGIHCHIGSQITKLEPYRKALAALLNLVRALDEQQQRLEFLDLGGGLGIRYDNEQTLQPLALARMAAHELRARPELELCMEPGRYLIADAGLLLTTVLYRKRGKTKEIAIVDAGMNDLLRPALYGAVHPIVPALSPQRKKTLMDVAGPVCESSDVFLSGARLPRPGAGELLAILKAGAYGYSMSSQYNSRPRPAEVLVDGAGFRIVRARERFEDLVRGER